MTTGMWSWSEGRDGIDSTLSVAERRLQRQLILYERAGEYGVQGK